jgi:hypothetical protein
MKTLHFPSVMRSLLVGAFLLAGAGRSAAQPNSPDQLDQPRMAIKWYSVDDDGASSGIVSRTARLQMSGMQAGFITNPLSIEPDPTDPSGTSDSPDALQLNFGAYNPYFDLRLPGDPGMLGYYKVHSQLQLLDAGSTSVCVNLQGYAPAGQEVGGLANGPTYVVPGVACFQELGFGAGLHGFFGQNIQANNHWTDLTPNFQYGMAVHCAVPGASVNAEQGLFVYFEALGRYRTDPTQPTGHTAIWEFVPGVQMRLNDSCWMSVSASRYNFLTCSWRY